MLGWYLQSAIIAHHVINAILGKSWAANSIDLHKQIIFGAKDVGVSYSSVRILYELLNTTPVREQTFH